MVEGYDPIIKTLAKDIDVRLNTRYLRLSYNWTCINMILFGYWEMQTENWRDDIGV